MHVLYSFRNKGLKCGIRMKYMDVLLTRHTAGTCTAGRRGKRKLRIARTKGRTYFGWKDFTG